MAMKKYIKLTFILLLINPSLHAQQIGLRALTFLGMATNTEAQYFFDGGGLELFYQHELWKGKVVGGLEYRTINWGNQVALNLGYNLAYWKKNSWRASVSLSVQGGMALFRQKPLGVLGIECLPELEWQSKKRFFMNLGIGIRYSNCPAYSKYSLINSTLDIPIKFGMGFRLGKKKEQ